MKKGSLIDRNENIWNVPNLLTMLRMAAVVVFIVLFARGKKNAAMIVFILAAVTDVLDGYIARHYNQVTDFGKFLDPLADKLLVTACMMIFVGQGRMASWIVFIVIAREFAVTGLRLVAVGNGRVIAAGWSGKIKTSCTMVGLILMMAVTGSDTLDLVVSIVILVTTVYSGVEYFCKNWDVLNLKA